MQNSAFEGLEEDGEVLSSAQELPPAVPERKHSKKRKKKGEAEKEKEQPAKEKQISLDEVKLPPLPPKKRRRSSKSKALAVVKPKAPKQKRKPKAAFVPAPSIAVGKSTGFQLPTSFPSLPSSASSFAPTPAKRAKKSKPLTGKHRSIALHQELSGDIVYKTLRAYFRNKPIANILAKEGCKATADQLRRLSSRERELLLVQVEEALDLATHTSVADTASENLLTTLEQIVHSNTRFKIAGTTAKCFADKHWMLLYERAKIKNGIGLDPFDPLTELAIKTYGIAVASHSENVIKGHGIDLDAPVAPSSE